MRFRISLESPRFGWAFVTGLVSILVFGVSIFVCVLLASGIERGGGGSLAGLAVVGRIGLLWLIVIAAFPLSFWLAMIATLLWRPAWLLVVVETVALAALFYLHPICCFGLIPL